MERSIVIEVVVTFLFLVFCQPCGGSLTSTANAPATVYSGRCSSYSSRSCSDEFNCTSPHGLPCDEAYALKAFIDGLALPDQTPFTRENCNVSTESITITCSCTTNPDNINVCHVIAIITAARDLSNGIIHDSVSKLSYLQNLNLGINKLHCNIPQSLDSLSNLKFLRLYNNFLYGSIPTSFGNLRSLEEMDLSRNMLSGEIPQGLGKLKNLQTLRLEENQLNGNLPWELGDLTNLQHFELGSNYLTGILNESYHKFVSMEHFDVAGNSLSGPIPNFFSKWENLTSLKLMGNDFEGNLPLEIFNMSNLEILWVSDLKNTKDFNFPEAANLTNIESLVLRNCSINGHIPMCIGNWSGLSYLDLSFNNLTGGIPDYLKNVSAMLLTGNMLEGQIPPWINQKYQDTDVSYNNFTIHAPQNSENATSNFTAPNLSPNRNYITDAKAKQCDSKYYNLFINCGGGNITSERDQYDEDTSQSKSYESPGNRWAYTCSGNFLSNYADSSDYIKNKTCGVSDGSLQETARLCPVSLTYYGFCLHNGNYTVTLQFAEIVYAKDEDYSNRSKRVFDVYIQGEKKLENFNIKDETHGEPNKACPKEFVARVQDNLLVIHFFWAGKGSLFSPTLNGPLVSAISVTPNFTISGGKKLSSSQIAGITVGSALAPVLLLVFLWKMGWLGYRELKKVYVEVQGRRFTLQQIIDATRNFSPKMEIGRGRFGIVYKAELPDQIKLAVKKISPDSMHDKLKTELQGEIFNLKSLKHENLIQLFDGYSRNNLHLLVYEYMENGSLHQVLLDPNSTVVLNWKVRLDICLGLAKALKYLHEENSLKILHRNLKASNILLDESYAAKLSDFGWARHYSEEDPFMTIRAGASRVYLAPEYATGQPITDKADVYSYGVVALEVFSGRPSIDYKPNREAAYLVDDARIAHAKQRIDKLVDRKMDNYDRKVVFNVLNLAIMCIHPTADLRPTMSEVVSVLSDEKTVEQITKVHIS